MKKIQFLVFFLFIGILINSCKKPKSTSFNSYNVNLSDAKIIANNLLFNIGKNLKQKKEIASINNVPDENNKTVFYIINYKQGGFIILSADKRSKPILAYSNTNNFNMNSEFFPSGLIDFLVSQKEKIKYIREHKIKQDKYIEKIWKNLLEDETSLISYRIDPPEPNCDPYNIIKGPLLQTSWGQGCGYNSLTPILNCNVPCGHAFTGCVATSMAQVMKFFQSPSNYDWINMPPNYGTTSTATLMRDIGVAVNMNYNCDSSGATMEDAKDAFINDFGYNNADYTDYNHDLVMSEIDQNRPVILSGGTETGWWIFSKYTNGHAWVCDGYNHTIYPCWGSFLYMHMNWGWNGSYNGWYAFNDFAPGNYTFNYRTKMIYHINP